MNPFTKLTTVSDVCILNGPETDIAGRLLYREVPIHFVWVKMGYRYVWQPRQRGGYKAIGRVISRYQPLLASLDIVLPRSFEDLKTVEGVVMETYKAVALSLGFLEFDEESHRCILESSAFQMPRKLRHLFRGFVGLLPTELWRRTCNRFAKAVSEMNLIPFGKKCQMIINLQTMPVNNQFIAMQSIWQSDINMNITLQTVKFGNFHDVEVASDVAYRKRNRLLVAETSNKLDESRIPHRVQQITDNLQWEMIFLDDTSGTGKSFLLEKILAYVQQKEGVALAVARCGIGAQLLTGGRTAHSAFKLPLDPHETSTYQGHLMLVYSNAQILLSGMNLL
ncbi:Helitron helicase [Phytophthora megakarya]|uniref:ATP-dependent DNA helicase n=1 Tax=Phytophthora megakarya TaxID=4795 RepID=A0A225X366_9STRA|nr:Helitron helicase [Phytophthora megakarya]